MCKNGLVVDADLVPDFLAHGGQPLALVLQLLEFGIKSRLLGEELWCVHLGAHKGRRHGRPVALHVLACKPEQWEVDGSSHTEAQDQAVEDGLRLVVAVPPGPDAGAQGHQEEDNLGADVAVEAAVLVAEGLVEWHPGLPGAALPLHHCDQEVIIGDEALETEERGCKGTEHLDCCEAVRL